MGPASSRVRVSEQSTCLVWWSVTLVALLSVLVMLPLAVGPRPKTEEGVVLVVPPVVVVGVVPVVVPVDGVVPVPVPVDGVVPMVPAVLNYNANTCNGTFFDRNNRYKAYYGALQGVRSYIAGNKSS
ncbi:hypothetical protein RHMOL_Rhmol12G0158800 [Rhododendron molle]|uniref:Uncharacterized protein n=1 Tax=Rhododendron molle TaxID=49168 RepID=A0ACC0LJY7_RHOML|nr:hypothetical protein RHMOL_Rhmol12G0158800 [Rhododendron molle]